DLDCGLRDNSSRQGIDLVEIEPLHARIAGIDRIEAADEAAIVDAAALRPHLSPEGIVRPGRGCFTGLLRRARDLEKGAKNSAERGFCRSRGNALRQEESSACRRCWSRSATERRMGSRRSI